MADLRAVSCDRLLLALGGGMIEVENQITIDVRVERTQIRLYSETGILKDQLAAWAFWLILEPRSASTYYWRRWD